MVVVQTYEFNPGDSGEGTIIIPAILKLEDFGVITNVTRGSVLYAPFEGHAGAKISYDGSNTVLTLEQKTTYCLSTDDLQIIVLQDGGGGGEPATDVHVTNTPLDPVPISGSVIVTNDSDNPASVQVENWPTSFEVSNDVGNPLPVTGLVTIGNFSSSATDAFGRLRVSNPFPLFDSSHRYSDNGLWATSTTSGGTATFNANQGLVDLSVTSAANSEVIRETYRVFPYQPGKGLLIMNTFVMAPARENLRQRVGYFGQNNGCFLELNETENSLCFVRRSSVSGSIVETRVSQNGGVYGFDDLGWNVDKLNGEGPSGIELDITRAQILFMDIEWLGVGTVRMGFVIDGQFIICHKFNHANLAYSTYMTTATLPLRYEIKNLYTTGSPSTLKQICSTVISEGGYEPKGSQGSIGTPVTSPKALTNAGTFYPVVAIRLKSDRLDAVVITEALSLLGVGNNEKYEWRLLKNPSIAGGEWVSAGSESPVEYNISASSISGGETLSSGYFSASNQGSPTIDISDPSLLATQLERNSFTSTPFPLAIAVAGANASQNVFGSLDWKEISR